MKKITILILFVLTTIILGCSSNVISNENTIVNNINTEEEILVVENNTEENIEETVEEEPLEEETEVEEEIKRVDIGYVYNQLNNNESVTLEDMALYYTDNTEYIKFYQLDNPEINASLILKNCSSNRDVLISIQNRTVNGDVIIEGGRHGSIYFLNTTINGNLIIKDVNASKGATFRDTHVTGDIILSNIQSNEHISLIRLVGDGNIDIDNISYVDNDTSEGILVTNENKNDYIYPVDPLHTEFDDYEIYSMSSSSIESESSLIIKGIVYKHSDDVYNIYLFLTYLASDWLFIESIDVLCDEEKYSFNSDEEFREVGYSGSIKEEIYFNVNDEFMNVLVNSKEVKVRVNGDRYYVTGEILYPVIKHFKYFYENYVISNNSE